MLAFNLPRMLVEKVNMNASMDDHQHPGIYAENLMVHDDRSKKPPHYTHLVRKVNG